MQAYVNKIKDTKFINYIMAENKISDNFILEFSGFSFLQASIILNMEIATIKIEEIIKAKPIVFLFNAFDSYPC